MLVLHATNVALIDFQPITTKVELIMTLAPVSQPYAPPDDVCFEFRPAFTIIKACCDWSGENYDLSP